MSVYTVGAVAEAITPILTTSLTWVGQIISVVTGDRKSVV